MPTTCRMSGRSWASLRVDGTRSSVGAPSVDPPARRPKQVPVRWAARRRQRAPESKRPTSRRNAPAGSPDSDARSLDWRRYRRAPNNLRRGAGFRGQRQRRRLSDLATGRTGRGADVVEAVPDLEQNQNPVQPIDLADIDRSRGIVGPCRKLEARGSARRGCEAEDQLLGHKVAGIAWRRVGDVSAESDGKRSLQRDPDRNPRLEGGASTVAELQVADLRLAQADPVTERRLCDTSSVPRRACLAPQGGRIAPASRAPAMTALRRF